MPARLFAPRKGHKAFILYVVEEAIAGDPSFARAYPALADFYVMAAQVATATPAEVLSKIKTAASRAVELDGTLCPYHPERFSAPGAERALSGARDWLSLQVWVKSNTLEWLEKAIERRDLDVRLK